MALILGCANNTIAPGASAALALIRLRTGIRIITSRAIRFIRI